MRHRAPRPPPDRRGWRLTAAVLAAVALGCAGSATVGRPHGPVVAAAEPSAPVTGAPSGPLSDGHHEAGSRPDPVELRIPAIAVRTRIISLGLQRDGTVEVPADPDQAGWYRRGPAPGDHGSAAILGHVDSTTGPAVFARLGSVTPGTRIAVVRSDGSVATFTVRAVRTYPNAEFPAASVYRSTGRPSLTLVTCGGAYDRSRHGYQANVVVFADLTGTGV